MIDTPLLYIRVQVPSTSFQPRRKLLIISDGIQWSHQGINITFPGEYGHICFTRKPFNVQEILLFINLQRSDLCMVGAILSLTSSSVKSRNGAVLNFCSACHLPEGFSYVISN
jgi:hypothetical protein